MTKIGSPSPIFQAQWPETIRPTFLSKAAEFAQTILSYVVFPSRIAYSGARVLIHPASFHDSVISDVARKRIQEIGGKLVQFKTPDGETLEGAYFKGSSSSKKGIVFAPGNNTNFSAASPRHINPVIKFLKFTRKNVGNVDVLVLNYRGVGNSTGSSSPQGLALDTYSAAEYLHKRVGIQASKVLFYGHSLGGYATAKGAALFQKEHKNAKVSIVSDRSFSDLATAADTIFGAVAKFFVHLLQWQLDARAEWRQLKGRKIIVYDKADDAIPYAASFFEGMQKYDIHHRLPPKVKSEAIELVSQEADAFNPHNRALNHAEAAELGRRIRSAL